MDPGDSLLTSLNQRFRLSISRNDVEEVNTLLSEGLNVDTTFSSGRSVKPALYICTEVGSIEVAKLLIQNGCNVNLPTSSGLTPLLLAVRKRHHELTLLLLQKGARVDARNSLGQTPLHIACSIGCYDIFLALVDAGAEINTTDRKNRTPLIQTCFSGYTTIALALLDRGADVNFTDDENNTALTHALSFEPSTALIKRLIQEGAQVNANRGDPTPVLCFMKGLRHNFSSNIPEACNILKLLIESGCQLNVSTWSEHNPLTIAAVYGMGDIVKILLNCGCNYIVDSFGRTPLFYACYHNVTQLVRLLIASGISWNQETWLQDETYTDKCNTDLVAICVEESQKFPKLEELSRRVIRGALAPDIEMGVDRLQCPPVIRKYIKLEHY